MSDKWDMKKAKRELLKDQTIQVLNRGANIFICLAALELSAEGKLVKAKIERKYTTA